MGRTRRYHSWYDISCDLTTRNTRTHKNPMAEQNTMCHMVNAMGNGKPEKASSHLLNKITADEMDIHMPT
jgi:hypothetical protein